MTPQQQVQILQNSPTSWIEIAFDEVLWEKQKQICNSIRDNRRTAVRSCHGIGKSFISARIALWYLYTHHNSKVITTAPTFRQVQEILWKELRTAKDKSRINLGGKIGQTALEISNSWFALGLSTNEPSRFQGFHAVDILLICDEAAGITEDIYNASEGIVSSDRAKVLYIGNPTDLSGSFYQAFKQSNFSKISISAFDTPNFTEFGITMDDIRNDTWEQKIDRPLPRPYLITPEWVSDKFKRWGEGSPMWESRVMGNFPEQGEDTLIPLGAIERAVERQIENNGDVEQIGADIARFGSDHTVFCYRKGSTVQDFKVNQHDDTMMTANRLRDFSGFHPMAKVYMDEIGVGAGVVDRMKQLMNASKYEGINVGKPANNTEMFLNLRAEIYWNLRERFLSGDISIPNDEELISQLANIKFKYTNKGQIQLESKEDIKKRGLGSPDMADALALSFGNFQTVSNIINSFKAWNE